MPEAQTFATPKPATIKKGLRTPWLGNESAPILLMRSLTLIDSLGVELLPGGLCQWGPTLLAADPCLGGRQPKGSSDLQILKRLSLTVRERDCSRLVILGKLFSNSADPDGDLPGLLVTWRSELLETEIIWVYPKALPAWSGILDFLELKVAPSGCTLGEAELISAASIKNPLRLPAFVGGVRPSHSQGGQAASKAWWASESFVALPPLGGAAQLKTPPDDPSITMLPVEAWPELSFELPNEETVS